MIFFSSENNEFSDNKASKIPQNNFTNQITINTSSGTQNGINQANINLTAIAANASSTLTSPTAMFNLNKLSPNRTLARNHSDSDIKSYQNQLNQQNFLLQQQLQQQQNQQTMQNEISNRQSVLEKLVC